MFKTILCAIDGSDHARLALELSVQLARSSGGKLILQHNLLDKSASAELERFAEIEGLTSHVTPELDRRRSVEARLEYGYTPLPEGTRTFVEIGEHLLDNARREAEAGGVPDVETVMTDGDAADSILRAVRERGADCVVIGSRGLSDAKALFLGSVSHKVMNRAPCTCIAVK
jgi:nucleotide-binding universal stress UspA family protein